MGARDRPSPAARAWVARRVRRLLEDGKARGQAIKVAWAEARDRGFRTG
jgi:hypothetical protein